MIKNKKIQLILSFTLIFSFLLSGCSSLNDIKNQLNENVLYNNENIESAIDSSEITTYEVDGLMKVHFIDVGQGDSCFIEFSDDTTMLVDAGPKSSSDSVVSYIETLGYESIDIAVATHPHEDHIGGFPAVLDYFDVGAIYMPDATANTNIFSQLLDSIENEGLTIKVPENGSLIKSTSEESVKVLAPVDGKSYDNLNNYSIILLIEHGSDSFLLMGDAEDEETREMLESWSFSDGITVLKAAHHGSSNGIGLSDDKTYSLLLEAIQPQYAVISCGSDNSYGHPHSETIRMLDLYNVQTLRTDLNGNIVFESDGNDLIYYASKV